MWNYRVELTLVEHEDDLLEGLNELDVVVAELLKVGSYKMTLF